MLGRLSQGQTAILGAVALAVCGHGTAEAEAEAEAPVMALGVSAAPPIGFLELCQRDSTACVAAGEDLPDLEALRAAALRRFWNDTFAQRSAAPAAAAAADAPFDWSRVFATRATPAAAGMADAPFDGSRVSASSTVRPSWSRLTAPRVGRVALALTTVVGATAPTAIGAVAAADVGAAAAKFALAAGAAGNDAVDTEAGAMTAVAAAADDRAADPGVVTFEVSTLTKSGEAAPSAAEAVASYGKTFDLDRAGWLLVNGINRRVNRAIRQIADDRLYGVADFWAVPAAGRGDCEDFVLAKREALISAGVPSEALSIAIVTTRWGESHAVLLLASDQGEYVLDSLSPWVSRWDRVDYSWRERQRPGQPFDWVEATI